MDANIENPYERQFAGDPLATIAADRGKYVAAVLTVARAYIVAGRPQRPSRLASYEAWSDLVRGALIWLGHRDPVLTTRALQVADPVNKALIRLFEALADKFPPSSVFGQVEFTVKKLTDKAKEDETLKEVLLGVAGGDDGTINTRRLGRWFRRHRGRIAAGWKLGDTKALWTLAPTGMKPNDEMPPY
jgi:putative DNA primase/helicase